MVKSTEERAELHNQPAGRIVRDVVRPIYDSGGSGSDLMVLLESVNVGVLMAASVLLGAPEDHDKVVDILAANIKVRWSELRTARARAAH